MAWRPWCTALLPVAQGVVESGASASVRSGSEGSIIRPHLHLWAQSQTSAPSVSLRSQSQMPGAAAPSADGAQGRSTQKRVRGGSEGPIRGRHLGTVAGRSAGVSAGQHARRTGRGSAKADRTEAERRRRLFDQSFVHISKLRPLPIKVKALLRKNISKLRYAHIKVWNTPTYQS